MIYRWLTRQFPSNRQAIITTTHFPLMVRFLVEGEAATRQWATAAASCLFPGLILGLTGDLGAGKTTFTRGLALALGCPPELVNSPTFSLIQEYPTQPPLRHCDTYRLRNSFEFEDLGLEDLFAPDGVTILEWANRVTELLPNDRLDLQFEAVSESARQIDATARGTNAQRFLTLWKAAAQPWVIPAGA